MKTQLIIFVIFLITAMLSCRVPEPTVSFLKINLKLNSRDSIDTEPVPVNIKGEKPFTETQYELYRYNIRDEIICIDKKGLYNILLLDQGKMLNGKVFLFKKGRLRFELNLLDGKANGPSFQYSKHGKLNAIYNYKNNKIIEIIYASKQKFRVIDSSFVPFKIINE